MRGCYPGEVGSVQGGAIRGVSILGGRVLSKGCHLGGAILLYGGGGGSMKGGCHEGGAVKGAMNPLLVNMQVVCILLECFLVQRVHHRSTDLSGLIASS